MLQGPKSARFYRVKSSHLPESSLMREKSLSVTFLSTSSSSASSSTKHLVFRPRMSSIMPLCVWIFVQSLPFDIEGRRYCSIYFVCDIRDISPNLPIIDESLQADAKIDENNKKEKQPMTILIAPPHPFVFLQHGEHYFWVKMETSIFEMQ